MNVLRTREEREELLNRKMEEMKNKNAELIRRHQLAEEDKRLAEEQGRSITNKTHQAPFSPMKGEILRAAEDEKERKTRQQNNKSKSGSEKFNKQKMETSGEIVGNGPPPDPACKFLADRRREGPLPDARKSKECSRRHPRNFGGTDFKDVPKKIHDEKEKQVNQPQMKAKDFTIYTTGKERLELQEWRKEREKIDRERLERQKNKEGNWRREWDQDKDELSYSDQPKEAELSIKHGQEQTAIRPDDRFKASGRGKWFQQKKNSESKYEVPYEFKENKMEIKSCLSAEKSLNRSDPKCLPSTEERPLRVVHERNDSLVIKVNNQLPKSPTGKTVSFAEPYSHEDVQQSYQKKGQKTSYEGTGVWLRNCSESSQESSRDYSRKSYQTSGRDSFSNASKRKAKKEMTTKEANLYSKDFQSYPEKLCHEQQKERLSVESHEPDDTSQNSPKNQNDIKAERVVGMGRINANLASKKGKNRKHRKRDMIFKNKQCRPKNNDSVAPGLAIIITKTNHGKTLVNDDEESGKGCNHLLVGSKQMKAENGEKEIKGNKAEISKCLEEEPDKSNMLDASFDLDQDPPEGTLVDDEEWEDIDEEICIDLINRGNESYEGNSLDISDESFEQQVSENAMPPRNHVDWAAEMESVEQCSSSNQETTADVMNQKCL